MIQTINPQVIDAMGRLSSIVYMEASRADDDVENGLVVFNIDCKILVTSIRDVIVNVNVGTNEVGGERIQQQLKKFAFPELISLPFLSRAAKYKQSTFYTYVGNPTPDQYDDVLMQEITRVNSQQWSGNEYQKIFFWELGMGDMKKISNQELIELTTPYEVLPE